MRKFLAHLKDWQNVTIFDNDENLPKVAFYQLPTISSSIKYNPDIWLDWDTWYRVTLDPDQKEEMIWPYINGTSGATSTSTISSENYDEVKALFLLEGDDSIDDSPVKMIISKVTASKIIKPERIFLVKDGSPDIIEQKRAITFNGYIDAYFDGIETLYFRNLPSIKSLFKWIEIFHKIATQEQKMEFLENQFFTTTKNRANFPVGDRNMRRIALVMEQLAIKWVDLSKQETRDIYIAYANKYKTSWKISINISTDWELEFSTNDDLWEILDVLEENLYTTEISHEPRVSHTNKS